MSTQKYLHFRSPYIFSTFNKVQDLLIGTNGVLFGMKIEDAGGGDIYVKKGAFVLKGLIIELEIDVLLTPTSGIVPLYLLASTASVFETDPVVWTFTSELSEISDNSSLIGKFNGDEWVSPEKLSLNEIITENHVHNKYVDGKGVYEGYFAEINDTYDTIAIPKGYLIDGVGTKYQTTETVDFTVGDLDLDFPRRDLIVYRRPVDDWRKPGILEKVVGPTYSLSEFSRFENVRENQISSTSPSLSYEKPQCLVGSDNALHVFYLASNNLYYEKWNSARDTELVAQTQVEIGIEEFQAVIDQNDKIHITGLISGNIVYKRMNDGGGTEIATKVVSSQPNAVTNPTIAFDNLGYIYIMYVHVEQVTGIPNYNRQIYFTKLNPSGTTAILPFKATLDSNDYITPKIEIDEDRIIHLATENEAQNRIYYGSFDDEGNIHSSMIDISDDTGGNFGTGEYTALGTTPCNNPVIKLSDIGDVYVAWTQERTHPSLTPKSLVLYHPSFKEIDGFKALVLGMDNQNLGYGEYGYGVRGYGRDLVDRAGTIISDEDVANPTITIDGYRNIIIAVDARLDPTDAHSIWAVKMSNTAFGRARRLVQLGPFQIKHTFTYGDTFETTNIIMDKTGCISAVWSDTQDIHSNKSTASIFIEGFVESDIELWLTEISFPANVITKLEDVALTNRVKNNIIDRTNKVTVGINETTGDFVGDHGIKEAIDFLKNFGGTLEIKGGTYQVGNSYELFSGIKIKTLGNVYFEKIGGIGPIFSMTGKKAPFDSKTTYSFTDLDVDFRAEGFLIGDTVDFLDTSNNFLQRTRVVGIDGTGGVGGKINITVHTKDQINTFAAKYIVYRSGVSIEDATLLGNTVGNNVELNYAENCRLYGVTSDNSFEHGVHVQNSLNCYIQNCQANNNNDRGIMVENSKAGGVYVVNNICSGNAIGSDGVDIEFTITTQDNFVWANKANLLDLGTNNQPSQVQVNSISPVAFDNFIKHSKINTIDANSGNATNPYNISIDNDGSAHEGLYFLSLENLEYDYDGNFYFSGKSRQIIISLEGGWRIKRDLLTGMKSIISNVKNAKITVTYYGTAVIMLAKMGSFQSTDLTKKVDGSSMAISLTGNRGSLSDEFVPFPLYDSQTKEYHHVEIIRNDVSNEKAFEISGFFVQLSTGEASAIHMNKGSVFVNGLQYNHPEIPDLAVPTFSGNARTDCISGGTNGAYQVIQGTVIGSGGEKYLSSVNMTRSLEEVSVRDFSKKPEIYSVDEFDFFDIDGEDFVRGNYVDTSILMWSSLAGLYAGVKKDISTFDFPTLKLDASSDQLHLIIKGTGLTIEVGSFPGLDTEDIQVYVDGSLRGSIFAPTVSDYTGGLHLGIFQDLPDVSHHVIFKSKTGNIQPCLYLHKFIIYRSKRPAINPSRIRIATYRNLPNVSEPYIIHRLDRCFYPDGASWTDLGFDPNRFNGAGYQVIGNLGHHFEVRFYGVGIKLFYNEEIGSSACDVLIDGVTPSSLGATGTGNTIPVGGANTPNKEAYWRSLSPAYHTLKITPKTTSALFKPNAIGVICGKLFGIQQHRVTSPVEKDIKRLN